MERLADSLIWSILDEGRTVVEAIEEAFNLMKAFKGRHAAWISPSDEIHKLPDRGDYWHHHWVKDNLDKIPDDHKVHLPTGEVDGIDTKLKMKHSGWIEKNAPHKYNVSHRHLDAALGRIRAHIGEHHGNVKQFEVSVIDDNGAGIGENRHFPVDPGKTVRPMTDIARARAIKMPKGGDPYANLEKIGQRRRQSRRRAVG